MKLQVVVVIYKKEIALSKAISSLFQLGKKSGLDLHLLIYDNSPTPQACDHPIKDLFPLAYVNDPTNEGLVPAYNRGLLLAEEIGAEWLLLLDEDTTLTAQYFVALERALSQYEHDPSIAAVVPHILVRGRCIAPTWFRMGIHFKMRVSWHGVAANPITTVNSMSVVRTSFLRSLGGFDRRYPFNYTDYWFYREVYRRGKKALVLDAGVAHEMSAANRDTYRPVPQYRDVLHHEGIFYRSSGSRLVTFVFWSRLMLRVVKHYFVFKDKGYSLATLSYIRRELLHRPQ